MDHPIDDAKLARYLSGECTKRECVEIQAWAVDSRNQGLLKLMQEAWNMADEKQEASDVSKLWKEAAQKAGISLGYESPERMKKPGKATFVHLWPFRGPLKPSIVFRYAAVLAVAIALPFLLSKLFGPNAMKWNELMVERGKRVTFTLCDGSRLTLDAGSSLKYPGKFEGSVREVYLDGEAYFEVSPDPQKPFVVRADGAVIRVLGTKFNVRAWEPDEKVCVAVTEGKVSLKSSKDSLEAGVVIHKGHLGILSESGQVTDPQPVDVKKYLGWMQNEVIFEDASLGDILFQLERWYDLRFVLADSVLAQERLTLHIQQKNVHSILDVLAALTDTEYEKKGNTVRFYY